MTAVPASWARVPLRDIAELQLGKMLDRSKQKKGSALPYLRNINVRWFDFDLSDLLTMHFEAYEIDKFSILDNDIFVCEGGEPGRAAIWRNGATDLKFQKAVHRVRACAGVIPDWIVYFLKSAAINGLLEEYFTGSTIKHLTSQSLSSMTMPLPPAAEQQRIVAQIETLRERSGRAWAALEAIPALIDRYRKAVLAAAFRGDLTADWRAENRISLTTWQEVTLDQIIDSIDTGKNLRCEERTPNDGERGIVKVNSVSWGKFDPNAAKVPPSNVYLDQRRLIKNGDLLMSRANTIDLVGAAVIVSGLSDEQLYLSDKVLRLNVPTPARRFLLHFLRSPNGRKQIEERSTGNQLSMRNISQNAIRSLRVSLPADEEIGELVRRIESIEQKIQVALAYVRRASARLTDFDRSILAKAFQGELVPQNPDDEPASVLLDRISAERAADAPPRRRGRHASPRSCERPAVTLPSRSRRSH